MSEEENHYISIIYYKLIDIIHINSGCIEEFRQNLTDHVFTINKRGIKYCRDREKNNKISSMEISKRFFASFCTPILLHRARKKMLFTEDDVSRFSPFHQLRSSIAMANVTWSYFVIKFRNIQRKQLCGSVLVSLEDIYYISHLLKAV